jgi:putative SOS response-associated peptidase YedK
MPVILPIYAEHRWLTQTGHGVQWTFPLTFPADEMRCYPASMKVNKASFNEPEAIAPLEPVII